MSKNSNTVSNEVISNFSELSREEMLALIKKADVEYYMDDNPTLTDAEYDKLRYDYISKYGESDLDYVPGDVKQGLKPFTHPMPVTSLDKIKAHETDKLKKELSRLFPVIVEDKLDGLTIVIYPSKQKEIKGYNNGIFAVTRGHQGITGEIVRKFISKYDLTKVNVDYPIRGEVIMRKSVFDEINKERVENGLEPYSHPRNAASGIIRSLQDDPNVDRLDFIAYDLLGCELTPTEQIAILKENTPFPVTETFSFNSVEEASQKIPELFEERSQNLDFPLDGMVIKSNIKDSLKKFGQTKHHPLNAFAWKGFQDGVETTLREIVPQVGRSRITYVAKFDTVILDRTSVSSASVSNMGIIRKLGLSIGAKILVNKSNQIIPQVVQILRSGDEEFIPPTVCPCCGHPLYEENDIQYCLNNSCRERLVQNVDYLSSKKVLNIKGLSEATINKLIDDGKISNLYDIFNLTFDDFMGLEGFSTKSANNLVSKIKDSRKNVDLAHYISACCIPMISIDIGEKLMNEFKTYDSILEKIKDKNFDFSILSDIGELTSNRLHSEEFVFAFEELHNYIIPVEEISDNVKVNTSGKSYTFVITGSISIGRDEMVELVKKAGSKVSGSVSGKTDYLVLGESDGKVSSKEAKARSLNIPIISEEELRRLLNI